MARQVYTSKEDQLIFSWLSIPENNDLFWGSNNKRGAVRALSDVFKATDVSPEGITRTYESLRKRIDIVLKTNPSLVPTHMRTSINI
jgi:hypothetical protein